MSPTNADVLRPSKPDDIALCGALHDRFLTLCENYLRRRGEELKPEPEMREHLKIWRRVVSRYRQGDMRHTLTEQRSIRTVAQWTVDVNCQLAGQAPKVLEWAD